MGKYDAIVLGLEKLPPEIREGGANYQYAVDQEKLNYGDHTPSVLIVQYADLRAQAEEKDREAKALRLRVEAISQLLMEVYEAEGITSMKVQGVGTMRTDFPPYSHVVDKETYRQWCLDNGFGPQMSLPWQTTNSVVKERLLTGQDIPPGVDVYVKPTPTFTREK